MTQFDGTSNESVRSPTDQIDPVKAERANYFDAGISQKITKHLQVGVDGYYKTAKHQLDDGLFGQTLILSAFNYAKGRVYGVEFTGSYTHGGFSTYANVAWSQAQGEDWSSAQFLFDPTDSGLRPKSLDLSGSRPARHRLVRRVLHVEGIGRTQHARLSGRALRQRLADGRGRSSSGRSIPNGGSVPAYYSVNLGAEQSFKLPQNQMLKARLDVVNLTDNIYELRDGSGVGVNAAQYGERLGFFGSLSYAF